MSQNKGSSRTQLMEAYSRTNARISKIQSHLQTAPRTGALDGKICIITGVGSLNGIGRASALLFAHEGARHLYLLDLDGSNLGNLKESIIRAYPDVKVTIKQVDAASDAEIKDICEQALNEEGRLDIFFANAGISSATHFKDTEAKDFMNMMRVNALSCFLALKYASSGMMQANPTKGKDESGGSIIMTASIAGLRSGAGPLDYSASKAAVNSMAKTAAFQLSGSHIRVNAICPGLIETGMTANTFDIARQRGTVGKIGQLNPMQRYGVPEEIAQVALFLASDNSSYVNGQNWAVDGGLSSSHPVIPGKLF